MNFESLESRRLMSVSLHLVQISEINSNAFVTGTGTLVVKGTAGGDELSLRQEGDYIRVASAGNFESRFALKNVKRILVEGASGNDKIYIDAALRRAETIVGGGGNDIMEGSYGATLLGGAGNDKLIVQPLKPLNFSVVPFVPNTNVANLIQYTGATDPHSYVGPALLSGGAGNDTLVTGGGSDSVIGGGGGDILVKSAGLLKVTMHSGGAPTVDGLAELSGVEQFQAFVGDDRGTVFI
jgi:Ca2+-binding RTX toxin-like protein